MRDNQSLDAVLESLSAPAACEVPADFMDGVWQRAGQLGEIADRRRRAALFVGLFVVGLGAGAGTSGWPGGYRGPSPVVGESLVLGAQLSPSALLHVEQ
jgi:hypothetical protein